LRISIYELVAEHESARRARSVDLVSDDAAPPDLCGNAGD
jgi:hypothetical protein